MVETSQDPLRVESLNPFHLARFQAISDSSQLPRFQAALLGDWMARLEQRADVLRATGFRHRDERDVRRFAACNPGGFFYPAADVVKGCMCHV